MISCQLHDYIEIVCLYRYPVKLILKNGSIIEGVALDTVLDENRQECIKLKSEKAVTRVILEDVSVLEVCTENPHFRSVSF